MKYQVAIYYSASGEEEILQPIFNTLQEAQRAARKLGYYYEAQDRVYSYVENNPAYNGFCVEVCHYDTDIIWYTIYVVPANSVSGCKGIGVTKEMVLFDNYDSYEYFDDYKQSYLEANDLEDCSDDEVYEIMSEQEQEIWNEVMSALVKSFGSGSAWGALPYCGVIACGTAGTWRGERQAMQFFDDIGQAIEYITEDCDYIKIWVDGRGHLFIRASHHDGTHEFELKSVTKDGYNYYWNWSNGVSPRLEKYSEYQILQNIWNDSKYSKLPKKITF